MASAEKLPSGRYRGIYHVHGEKRAVKGTYERKSDAIEAAEEEAVGARRQAAVKQGTLSAKTTWSQWWEILKKQRQRDDVDTDVTDERLARVFVEPRWGDVPLNAIADVQDWVDELKVGRKPSYVHRIYAVFRMSITEAVRKKILTASPCAGVRLPRVHKRPRAYLDTKTTALLRPNLPEVHADAIEFGLETGLRPGELAGLHIEQIDLDAGAMVVQWTYVSQKKVMRPWPKDKDVRVVPLTDKALEIVKRRTEGRSMTTGCGVPHSDQSECVSALVFTGARFGKVMSCTALYQSMRAASKSAKVPRKSPYTIRRGFATRAAAGGMDAFGLADLLGHSTLEQAQEYVQQTPAARDKLRAALGEVTGLRTVGPHGTGRGTGSSRTVTPDSSTERGEDAG